MFKDFLKTAVVGPISSEPLSVAGSCAHCAAANALEGAHGCSGFGPGCLVCAPKILTGVNRREDDSPLD